LNKNNTKNQKERDEVEEEKETKKEKRNEMDINILRELYYIYTKRRELSEIEDSLWK